MKCMISVLTLATLAACAGATRYARWPADGWEWAGQFAPVSNPNVCR